MTRPPPRAAIAMPFGAFYGRRESRRAVGEFVLDTLAADPERGVERHGHEEAHVVVVLSGLYLTSARGNSPLLGAGGIVFNPPGTVHRDRFELQGGSTIGRFLGISIGKTALTRIEEVGSLPNQPIVVRDPGAGRIAGEIVGVRRDGGDVESRVTDLLAAIMRVPEFAASPPWLETARALIADRSDEPLTTRAIAAALGVHPVYFARTFRRCLGVAPSEYLRQCRVRRAAGLLRHSRLSLADIAIRCGFADQSHLTRLFGRSFGVSPGRFRTAADPVVRE